MVQYIPISFTETGSERPWHSQRFEKSLLRKVPGNCYNRLSTYSSPSTSPTIQQTGLLLLLLLIHTFSVLSLQLKKLRWHNKSAIDLSNANPACGHKEVRRSTGHIMVTTRYSDQQGSKSRQKDMRLYKQWHRPISKRFIKPPYSISRATSMDSECCRLPTTNVLSKNTEKLRNNYAPTSFDH